VAVIGAGGTGSHAALALAYLGVGDVLVLDDDHAEVTNLNRLVTAGHADIGAPKNLVARRRMREIDPGLRVSALPALSPVGAHPELDDVDLIIGCVDHDGPRDRLNQIAVDTATPYIDVATGIDTTTLPPTVGGRAVLVIPGGPCLHCLGELDPAEISRWAKTPEQQTLDRVHGYGTPEPNPAVVHLNGIAVHAALGELVAWVSGHRPPAQYLDVDLSGVLARADSPPGCRVAPRRPARPVSGCICCHHRHAGALTAGWERASAPPGRPARMPGGRDRGDDRDGKGGGGPLTWYGDSAYGIGDLRGAISDAGHQAVIKPKPLQAPVQGGLTIDDFTVSERVGAVTCPARNTVALSRTRVATFGALGRDCPLRQRSLLPRPAASWSCTNMMTCCAPPAHWAVGPWATRGLLGSPAQRGTGHRPGGHRPGPSAQAAPPRGIAKNHVYSSAAPPRGTCAT